MTYKPDRPLRIGLLGASKIAPKAIIDPCEHEPRAVIAAVAASTVVRAKAYAAEHGCRAVAGYQELVEDPEIDLVYNGLQPSAHAALTIAALENGKHVLCEKPLCRTLAEADAMLAAADASPARLVEAYHYRYHPSFLKLMALRDRIEGPLELKADFDVWIPRDEAELRWRSDLGGGAMKDLGCYPLHACRSLVGDVPSVVSASADWDEGFPGGGDGVDRAMQAELRFANGSKARIGCSMVSREFVADVQVTGANGWARLQNFVVPHRGHELSWQIDGEKGRESLTDRPTYRFQLDAILKALETDGSLPTEGGDTGNSSLP